MRISTALALGTNTGAVRSAEKALQPTQMLPRVRERWRSIVERLADVARNTQAARDAIRELLGDRIIIRNENGALIAEAPSTCEISVVAGARVGVYLTSEPFRVPLPRTESAKYRR